MVGERPLAFGHVSLQTGHRSGLDDGHEALAVGLADHRHALEPGALGVHHPPLDDAALVHLDGYRGLFSGNLERAGQLSGVAVRLEISEDERIRKPGRALRLAHELARCMVGDEVPRDEVARLAAVVRETMEGALSLDVPLTVDVKVGDDWESMTPLAAD